MAGMALLSVKNATGYGKRVTFEIAPYAFDILLNWDKSTVLIISPCIALMESQVEELGQRGVSACYLGEDKETNLETDEDNQQVRSYAF